MTVRRMRIWPAAEGCTPSANNNPVAEVAPSRRSTACGSMSRTVPVISSRSLASQRDPRTALFVGAAGGGVIKMGETPALVAISRSADKLRRVSSADVTRVPAKRRASLTPSRIRIVVGRSASRAGLGPGPRRHHRRLGLQRRGQGDLRPMAGAQALHPHRPATRLIAGQPDR